VLPVVQSTNTQEESSVNSDNDSDSDDSSSAGMEVDKDSDNSDDEISTDKEVDQGTHTEESSRSSDNSEDDSDSSSSSGDSDRWDGDNTSDYKDEDDDHSDDSVTSDLAGRRVASLRQKPQKHELTTEEMIKAAQLKQMITEELARLRRCRRDCNRLDIEGNKLTTRRRTANCPITATDHIVQILGEEEDKLFKRVCSTNIQTKNAFMKQSAQFLTYAITDGGLPECSADDLATLVGKVVMAPISVVRKYADFLEENAKLSNESIRGRLCNISLLLTQFVDNITFRTEIPPVLELIKSHVKYYKGMTDDVKANTKPEDLLESGLLCSKGDLVVMENSLAPILADIFSLAEIQHELVPMQLYNIAMRIIGFQFYGTNLNGRHRGIAEMTEEDGFKLINHLYAATSKTKSFKARGNQIITVTDDLAINLEKYWRLLRPHGGQSDNFFLRWKGTALSGDDGSKGIATMLDDLFGLYLPVTTLRSINTTQIKICATENEINSEQSGMFHTDCQGHSRATADRLYTFMRQPSTAAVLAGVNATVNSTHGGETIMFNNTRPILTTLRAATPRPLTSPATSSTSTPSTSTPREVGSGMVTPRHIETGTPIQKSFQSLASTLTPTKLPLFDDFGHDHVDYGREECSNVAWSEAEVEYIKQFKASCTERNVFHLCLESIVSNPNEAIRRMFHKKHLRTSSILRDGVKHK
jgi:hypothetical protein